MISVNDIKSHLLNKGYNSQVVNLSFATHDKKIAKLNKTMLQNDKFIAIVHGEAVIRYGNGDVEILFMHQCRFVGVPQKQLKHLDDVDNAINRLLKLDDHDVIECKICFEKRDLVACSTCSKAICDECNHKLLECPFCRTMYPGTKKIGIPEQYIHKFQELISQGKTIEQISKELPIEIVSL